MVQKARHAAAEFRHEFGYEIPVDYLACKMADQFQAGVVTVDSQPHPRLTEQTKSPLDTGSSCFNTPSIPRFRLVILFVTHELDRRAVSNSDRE